MGGDATVNIELAQYSNYFIYSAMAVYLLAMIAFAVEWSFGSRSLVARQAEQIRAAAATAARSTAAGGVDGGGVALLTREEPAGPAGDDPVGTRRYRADLSGRIAISLTTLAFLLHLASVVCRGLSVQRVPWGNMYEFSVGMALAGTGVFLALLLQYDVRWLGLFVTVPVLLGLGLAVTVLYTEAEQLVPALDSYWLPIHVTGAVLCSGLFTVGAVLSLLYLVVQRRERAATPRGRERGGRLPAAEVLDSFAYRVHAFVFPLWTFTIVGGAIWAHEAWGRYWGWDPKETWSFVTWVLYAGYLHARATAGWKGSRAAVIALIAFGTFVFNYFGVNILFSGLHSYAGL